jgi:hypothetical protein
LQELAEGDVRVDDGDAPEHARSPAARIPPMPKAQGVGGAVRRAKGTKDLIVRD